MANIIKSAAHFAFDTMTFGPSRRSMVRTVTGSASRLSDLFVTTADMIGQRKLAKRARHETFEDAAARHEIDEQHIAHVHRHMTRMQRASIVSFGVAATALGYWSGSLLFGKPTLENIVSTAISACLIAACYAFGIIYGIRRFQIERRKLCSLGDYFREAGLLDPLLW